MNRRKILSALLCLSLVFTLFSFNGQASAATPQVTVSTPASVTAACLAPFTLPITFTGGAVDNNPGLLDIALVLDGSGSVGSANWNKTKTAALDFVNKINVGPGKAAITVVQSASTASATDPNGVRLTTDISTLRNKISALPYLNGESFHERGLKAAMDQFDLYGRANSRKVVVIIMDGFSGNAYDLVTNTNKLKTDYQATIYVSAYGFQKTATISVAANPGQLPTANPKVTKNIYDMIYPIASNDQTFFYNGIGSATEALASMTGNADIVQSGIDYSAVLTDNFQLVSATATTGRVAFSTDTNSVSWYGAADPDGETLTLSVKHKSANVGSLPLFTTSSYTAPDSDGIIVSAPIMKNVTVNACPNITPTTLADGYTGLTYNAAIHAEQGTPPYTFAVVGALPDGLTLDSATGTISGTPSAAGSTTFSIRLTDSNGATKDQSYTLNVYAPPAITTASLPSATKDWAYSAPLVASGGAGALVWNVSSGSLPAGLLINPATGDISGTPTAQGTFNFKVRATDLNSQYAERDLVLVVSDSLAITSTTLPQSTVGGAYEQTLTFTGGTGATTWSVASGALPAGLSLDSTTGKISGTPTAAGTGAFTVRATDSNGAYVDQSLTLQVNAAPVISTTSTPSATEGWAYSAQLASSGGTGAIVWSVSNGSLPNGLQLDAATGLLSGTPTENGTFNIKVKVTDANSVFAEQALTLVVNDSLAVTTTTLPQATKDWAYSVQLAASGGTGTAAWSLTDGNLPTGFQLNTASGLISGTPTATGTFNIKVRATDQNGAYSEQALTLTVSDSLAITTTTLPQATVSGAYEQTLVSTGGTGTVIWSVASGALPAGLSLDSTTGKISGTPTQSGSVTFTVRVTDSNGAQSDQSLTLQVNGAVTITTSLLPAATQGWAYSVQLAVYGGTGAIEWELSEGNLPNGMMFDIATGLISGTPTENGIFNIKVEATDSYNISAEKVLALNVSESMTIGITVLPQVTIGGAYDQTLSSSGGKGVITWSITSGNLPVGLSLDSQTGQISGVPSTTGTFSFYVTIMDENGAQASQAQQIIVNGAPMIGIAPMPLGVVGSPYASTLTATYGTPVPDYSWSVTDSSLLPPGLLLTSDGLLSGVPTSKGSYTFDVRATDSYNVSDTKPITVNIYDSLTITTTTLPHGYVGDTYASVLSVYGGTAPYSWEPVGVLPSGFGLSVTGAVYSNGAIPSSATSFTLQAKVTDSLGFTTISGPLIIEIRPMLTITTTVLPDGKENTTYPLTQLIAAGGDGSYIWSATSALPPGLSLTTTGLLSGTPNTPGTYSINLFVSDSSGHQAAQTITITIVPRDLYTDALLTTLVVNKGTLEPAFTPSVERYTLSVDNSVSELQVIGTYGVMGSVTLNGDAYSSGAALTVPLRVGVNTISIEATSEDGVTTRTYSIVVTRAEAPSSPNNNLSPGPSSGTGTQPPAPPTARVSSSALITPNEQTGVTVEQANNGTLLRVSVSSDRLQAIADSGNLAGEITIDTSEFDTGSSEIVLPLGDLLALSEVRDDISIELLTSSGTYRLPLAELGSISSQPDATVAIRVLQEQALETPQWTDGRLVSSIVGFEVWIQGSSSAYTELSSFTIPVEREIPIDQTYDPNRSTAVRILEDGTIEPVPTRFEGKTAIIQSFTNSQYAVIESNKKYSDIQGTQVAAAAILKLANKQVISGYTDGTFRPDGQITKAEAAALIYRAIGGTREPIPNTKFYSDVKATSWYAPAVVSLTKRGIISGAGNGKFNPNDLVTREQLAVMIANAMKHIDRDLLPLTTQSNPVVFTDANKQSKWAADSIALLANAGILTGKEDGSLDPRGEATRAETAVMLERALRSAALID